MKNYYVYLLASPSRTLYVGVTSDLERRLYEHKNKLIPGFTKRYNISHLVHFEVTSDIEIAIAREKEIKAWRRSKKVDLICSHNPTWEDQSKIGEKADSSLRSE